MGKLLWHTMMSLDGFIAGPNHDMSWVFGLDAGSRETVDAVLGSTGAFRGPFFVLRHDPPPDPPVVKGVTGRFLDVSIEEAVTIAKDAAGDGDVVILGANIARQCLENGLLDEIIVHVAPVLLGDGVRLFERAGRSRSSSIRSRRSTRGVRRCSATRSPSDGRPHAASIRFQCIRAGAISSHTVVPPASRSTPQVLASCATRSRP